MKYKLVAAQILNIISSYCAMFMLFVVATRFTLAYSKTETFIDAPAKIISVYDGDTVTVEFKIRANIRMVDCWAPEIKTKNQQEKARGLESKEYLQKILKPNDEVHVRVPFDGNISNSVNMSRVLGYIYKDVDGDGSLDDVSNVMVEKGYATKNKGNKNE